LGGKNWRKLICTERQASATRRLIAFSSFEKAVKWGEEEEEEEEEEVEEDLAS